MKKTGARNVSTKSNPSSDRDKWLRWPTINPLETPDSWLNEGLEIGLESAKRDKKKLQDGFKLKLFAFVFSLTGNILARFFRRSNASGTIHDIYQCPWLPLWPNLSSHSFHEQEPEWTHLLKDNYPTIRRELTQLINNDIGFQQAVYDGFKGKPWTAKYFHLFGKRIAETNELCPITSAVLEKIPHNLMHTCFSCIPAGGALPPHVGPTNTSLVCHLGLMNCDKSAIFSGKKIKRYVEGETLILDDSFIHGAKNAGELPRYTLMLSFWHPDLSSIEIKALKYFYKAFSSVGS